jgi:multisubunit Na+/H+ antiporter MnhC subunit
MTYQLNQNTSLVIVILFLLGVYFLVLKRKNDNKSLILLVVTGLVIGYLVYNMTNIEHATNPKSGSGSKGKSGGGNKSKPAASKPKVNKLTSKQTKGKEGEKTKDPKKEKELMLKDVEKEQEKKDIRKSAYEEDIYASFDKKEAEDKMDESIGGGSQRGADAFSAKLDLMDDKEKVSAKNRDQTQRRMRDQRLEKIGKVQRDLMKLKKQQKKPKKKLVDHKQTHASKGKKMETHIMDTPRNLNIYNVVQTNLNDEQKNMLDNINTMAKRNRRKDDSEVIVGPPYGSVQYAKKLYDEYNEQYEYDNFSRIVDGYNRNSVDGSGFENMYEENLSSGKTNKDCPICPIVENRHYSKFLDNAEWQKRYDDSGIEEKLTPFKPNWGQEEAREFNRRNDRLLEENNQNNVDDLSRRMTNELQYDYEIDQDFNTN